VVLGKPAGIETQLLGIGYLLKPVGVETLERHTPLLRISEIVPQAIIHFGCHLNVSALV